MDILKIYQSIFEKPRDGYSTLEEMILWQFTYLRAGELSDESLKGMARYLLNYKPLTLEDINIDIQDENLEELKEEIRSFWPIKKSK